MSSIFSAQQAARLDQRFGFAGDASAVPIGDGDVAGMAEAAESGDAMRQAIGDAGCGHEVFNGIDGADGDFAFTVGSASIFCQKRTGSRSSPSAMRRSH